MLLFYTAFEKKREAMSIEIFKSYIVAGGGGNTTNDIFLHKEGGGRSPGECIGGALGPGN